MSLESDKKDLSSGLFFLVLGFLISLDSLIRLTIWSEIGPDAGFFPFLLGIIIVGLSICIIIKSFKISEKGRIPEAQEDRTHSIFKVSSYLILSLLYGLLFERAGFLVASSLFMFLILKYVERKSWKITLFAGLASVIVAYVLFVYVLKVFLPKGLVKWW